MPPRSIRCWRSNTWSSTKKSAPCRSWSRPCATTGQGTRCCRPGAATKRPSTGGTTMRPMNGRQVMELWTEETWKHKTDHRPAVPPGMLSWNYWIADGLHPAASPDGRPTGKFLSNAICPSNGADIQRPDRQRQFGGQGAGRKSAADKGDWGGFSTTCPTAPAIPSPSTPPSARPGAQEKVQGLPKRIHGKRRHRLQINMLDADMLRDAQKHPENYRHLLVRSPATTPTSPPSARSCRTRSSPARATAEDGPGIRTTVFFKGCPLRCAWCHNPESISPPQVQWLENRCIGCHTCLEACPNRAAWTLRLRDPSSTGSAARAAENAPRPARRMPWSCWAGRDRRGLWPSCSRIALLRGLGRRRDRLGRRAGHAAGFCRGPAERLQAAGVSTALDTCGLVRPGPWLASCRTSTWCSLISRDRSSPPPRLHRAGQRGHPPGPAACAIMWPWPALAPPLDPHARSSRGRRPAARTWRAGSLPGSTPGRAGGALGAVRL
jgi:ferredoxin